MVGAASAGGGSCSSPASSPLTGAASAALAAFRVHIPRGLAYGRHLRSNKVVVMTRPRRRQAPQPRKPSSALKWPRLNRRPPALTGVALHRACARNCRCSSRSRRPEFPRGGPTRATRGGRGDRLRRGGYAVQDGRLKLTLVDPAALPVRATQGALRHAHLPPEHRLGRLHLLDILNLVAKGAWKPSLNIPTAAVAAAAHVGAEPGRRADGRHHAPVHSRPRALRAYARAHEEARGRRRRGRRVAAAAAAVEYDAAAATAERSRRPRRARRRRRPSPCEARRRRRRTVLPRATSGRRSSDGVRRWRDDTFALVALAHAIQTFLVLCRMKR